MHLWHWTIFVEAYQRCFGHWCAVERFLVVGDGGITDALRRVPHVVTFSGNRISASLAANVTRFEFSGVDAAYRRRLAEAAVAWSFESKK